MAQMVKKFGEKLGGKGQLYGSLKLVRGYQDPASRLPIYILCINTWFHCEVSSIDPFTINIHACNVNGEALNGENTC